MQLCKVSEVPGREVKVANPRERSRLDKVREEMCIPWRMLNELGRKVVDREFGDVSKLTCCENRRLIEYLERNRLSLMNEARRRRWNAR